MKDDITYIVKYSFKLSNYDGIKVHSLLDPKDVINWYKNIAWSTDYFEYDGIIKNPDIYFDNNNNVYTITYETKYNDVDSICSSLNNLSDPDDDGNYPFIMNNENKIDVLIFPENEDYYYCDNYIVTEK
jgi:hypothetical protein